MISFKDPCDYYEDLPYDRSCLGLVRFCKNFGKQVKANHACW